MAKITLLYFKPSGKWKYEGEINCPNDFSMYHLNEYVRNLKGDHRLPGLASGSWEGPIYIDSCEHPLGFPQLII